MLRCARTACTPGKNNVLLQHSARIRQHLAIVHAYATKAPTKVSNKNAATRPPTKSSSREQAARLNTTPPVQKASFVANPGTPPSTPATGQGKGYPEQILIYHAGTGRTVFISCIKLTAIFIFIWSAVLIAPAYYFSPLEANWKAAAALIGGAVPITFMVLTTAPFVTYVHLALPLWARASHTRLFRYASNLPSTAVVDITSLRWIWPRVTRLNASELYIHQNQVGAMTIRRNVPQAVKEARQWWQWRPLKQFYVAGKTGKTTEKGVWEEVVKCIAKNRGPQTPKVRGQR